MFEGPLDRCMCCRKSTVFKLNVDIYLQERITTITQWFEGLKVVYSAVSVEGMNKNI